MKIGGMQKLTLLDYPGKLACIIFTQGCNLKCPYCQNSGLIPLESEYTVDEEEILEYLKKRKGIIDGIVISGGEPTLQSDLEEFINKVKEMNILVKLDSNGCNPKKIKYLIDNKMIDYIAMDIKNPLEEYQTVAGCPVQKDKLEESINIIKNSNIDHEFRTTIIKNIHDVDKILSICSYIGEDETYYLQNFEQSENVIDKNLESFDREELKEISTKVKRKYPKVKVRGL